MTKSFFSWTGINVIVLAVFTAIALFLIFTFQSVSSDLVVVENNIDLGKIPIRGGKVNFSFLVKNTGDKAVEIIEGETSCMCTEAKLKGKDEFVSKPIVMSGLDRTHKVDYVIDPGETVSIETFFDPMAHGITGVGKIERDIYLKTNSEGNPALRLMFKVHVFDDALKALPV